MCLTLVCIPITRHKGQQSPVPSSSSLRPPLLWHCSGCICLEPPLHCSGPDHPTHHILQHQSSPLLPCQFEHWLAQSLPNWCVVFSRGDGGLHRPCGWPEHLDVGFPREGPPAPAHLALHFSR